MGGKPSKGTKADKRLKKNKKKKQKIWTDKNYDPIKDIIEFWVIK